MFSCSIGFGLVLRLLGGSIDGGFSTGTVILSLPGSSALRGGSFIWLPPPPPPPPGPGLFNQMMFGVRLLRKDCRRGRAWPGRSGLAKMTKQRTNATCQTNDATPRRPEALLLLLEQERNLDRVRALDVNRQVPG